MYDGPLCVAVFCFNRHNYLKRLCDSLGEQTSEANTSLVFFQDGAVNRFSKRRLCTPVQESQVTTILEHHKVREKFDSFQIFKQPDNVGVAIQQYEAYERLKGLFRYVVYLDDDVILSPNFLRVIRLLIPFLEQDDSLFSATPGFTRDLKKVGLVDQIPEWLDKVEYGHHPWIGYVMDMTKWDRIVPDFMEYMKLCEGVDYRQRPHGAIRRLHAKNGMPDKPQSSQDAWKDVLIRKHDMRKMRCLVNRGLYIGEVGLHGTPAHYRQVGWANHKPYDHPTDLTISELVIQK